MSSRAQQQEIYVDPGYEGRGRVSLGLDSFRIQDGILSIVASRIAPRIEAGFVQQRVVQGTNSYQ
jgi:hypothetical protein